jgi:YHS domain-containing protein
MNVRDPVCGRGIGLRDAVAPDARDGWAYFFRSPGYREIFGSPPMRFPQKREAARANVPAKETIQLRRAK